MTRPCEKWLTFHINASVAKSSTTYEHRVSLKVRPPGLTHSLHSLRMRSIIDGPKRLLEEIDIVDGDVCEIRKSLPSQDNRQPFPSRFFVEVRQLPTSPVEKFGFTIPHGATYPYEASCPLRPFPDDADALSYIASHRDLIEAYGVDPEAARRHYLAHGRAEGRELTFRPLPYIASHPDLFSFGTDRYQACRHFILHGYNEHRPITFDPFVYLSGHEDLIDQIPPDEEKIVSHYIVTGFGEGRRCKPFPWREYLEQNPDLYDRIENSHHAAARHYVLKGHREKRSVFRNKDVNA